METSKTKTPALLQAKNALKDYLKKHNLDPTKDWREDKVYGKEITRLVTRLNIERDKVLDRYPYTDLQNEIKFTKMKKEKTKKVKAENEAKKAKVTKETPAPVKETKEAKKSKPEAGAKEKKARTSAPTKYDYPQIDGREMTSAEKKKYRAEQRRLANGGEAKPKKAKEAKPSKKEAPATEAPVKEKKAKKAKNETVPEKPLKVNKAKKVKKEED